ncbi:serine/threonine-protein phosphatase 7 [Artemisia annua]|uniref:Serine/threonine-protein phosphatase 7 n=1 Tax=Artemisia annua TaxID=35608 RepID=A0A2U1KUW8_ARTAN|nr:serine/threonine-protein phosphatase 7 [Artemisia annua]
MTGKSGSKFGSWNLDGRIRELLVGSCFFDLTNFVGYKQRTDFLTYIESCYDKTNQVFRFGHANSLELYFGLQDVFAISGLPVDGQPIVCGDVNCSTLCTDLLGADEETRDRNYGYLSEKWLKRKFEVVPLDIQDHEILKYVRAYLLYIIGNLVVPNSDNTSYPIYLLNFLEDVTPYKLNSFAWGAAAHALLHSVLSGERRNMKGASWMLEDICWDPYVGYDGYEHQRIFHSRIILFYYDIINYHRPDKVPRQLLVHNPQPLQDMVTLKMKSLRGHIERKLLEHYSAYIKIWKEKRYLETINCSSNVDADNLTVHQKPLTIIPPTLTDVNADNTDDSTFQHSVENDSTLLHSVESNTCLSDVNADDLTVHQQPPTVDAAAFHSLHQQETLMRQRPKRQRNNVDRFSLEEHNPKSKKNWNHRKNQKKNQKIQ